MDGGRFEVEETEGTYGHLERERHEGRVNLDAVLGGVHSRPPASTLSDADGVRAGQLRDMTREEFMVEGKGFCLPSAATPAKYASSLVYFLRRGEATLAEGVSRCKPNY